MKLKSLLFTLAGAIALTTSSSAATIAAWTFEVNTPADLTDSATGPTVAADIGTGSMFGSHANAVSDWTTPAGNGVGSANSYSVNTWTVGDYFQFSTSTTGFTDGIVVSFDHTGSGTGPSGFTFQYSLDGTTFLSAGTYTIPTGFSWNASSEVTATHFTFDLSAVPSLSNAATVYFRLTDNGTVSVNGGTVAVGGTSRVDNFIIATIPEPASALLGVLGFVGILRRRR